MPSNRNRDSLVIKPLVDVSFTSNNTKRKKRTGYNDVRNPNYRLRGLGALAAKWGSSSKNSVGRKFAERSNPKRHQYTKTWISEQMAAMAETFEEDLGDLRSPPAAADDHHPRGSDVDDDSDTNAAESYDSAAVPLQSASRIQTVKVIRPEDRLTVQRINPWNMDDLQKDWQVIHDYSQPAKTIELDDGFLYVDHNVSPTPAAP